MKNLLLLLSLILSAEAFAGCADLPKLKEELHDKRIYLQGYEQAKDEVRDYFTNVYVSYEPDETLVLVPDLADKSTFEINMRVASLIGEILKLKKECK